MGFEKQKYLVFLLGSVGVCGNADIFFTKEVPILRWHMRGMPDSTKNCFKSTNSMLNIIREKVNVLCLIMHP